MQSIINTATQSFTPTKAEDLAAKLNADLDDDWTYTVKHDPKGTGYSLIEVFDEDGVFISYL